MCLVALPIATCVRLTRICSSRARPQALPGSSLRPDRTSPVKSGENVIQMKWKGSIRSADAEYRAPTPRRPAWKPFGDSWPAALHSSARFWPAGKTLVASVGPGRPFSPMPLAKHSYFAELTFVRTRSHAGDWPPDISRHPRKTGAPRDHFSGLGSILTDQRSWSSTSLSVTVMTSVGPSIATCPKN